MVLGAAGFSSPRRALAAMHWLTIDRWLIPVRLARFRAWRDRSFSILDVGCGNHSATFTKHWFPNCRYSGVDRELYNNDASDLALMERFYSADLESSALDEIPDGTFDLIICAHVIEHLTRGLVLLDRLCRKLAPGGEVYIEFPGPRSLGLPPMPGTLHFSDDPTHVRIYTIPEVANVLLARGLIVCRAGRRRSWPRVAVAPLLAVGSLFRHGYCGGGILWDFMGFADYVWARKPAVAPSPAAGVA